jgi:nucleoside-diphosphate-sugar epimerase
MLGQSSATADPNQDRCLVSVDIQLTITHAEKQRTDVADSVVDIEKVRRQLGYEPTVEIEDGITKL